MGLRLKYVVCLLAFCVSTSRAELPRQLPGEAFNDARHGEYAVKEAPVSSADPYEAKVYDNFSLHQAYVLNYIMWSGIFADPLPSTPQAIDFLIEFWGNTGTSSSGPLGMPDLSSPPVASFTLPAAVVGSTTSWAEDVIRMTPRGGAHNSAPVATIPSVAGGGPAVDYQAAVPNIYLPPGDYWISIQAIQSFDSPIEIDPEWQWHFSSPLPGDGYYAADLQTNPGAGLQGVFRNEELASGMAFTLFGMHPSSFHEPAILATATTIDAGTSKLIGRNGGANDAGYPAGIYTHFLFAADWEASLGTPTKYGLQLEVDTIGGVSSSGKVTYSNDPDGTGKVLFTGRFTQPYKPQENGFLQTRFVENSGNGEITLRNMKLQLMAFSNNPVDTEDSLTAHDDFHSSNIFGGEVEWNRIPHPGGPLTVDTDGSGFDTEIGLYASNGTLVDTNDDAIGLQSKLEFADLGPGNYFVASSAFDTLFYDGFFVRSYSSQPSTLLNTNAIVPPVEELCFPITAARDGKVIVCF